MQGNLRGSLHISPLQPETNGGPIHLTKPIKQCIVTTTDNFSDGSDHSDTEHDRETPRHTPLAKPLTVDYETRDGMAKHNKDFYSAKGTLVWQQQ